MRVSAPPTWSRVDEDTSPAVRLVEEVRALGDDKVRAEVTRMRSQTSAEQAAEAEAERLAWARESAARLRASF
jgi:hypothetical protein